MSFNALDAILLLCIVSAVIGGWRLGFVTRVASWVFMGAGVILGLNALPAVLRWIDGIDASGRLLVVVLTVLIGALLGQMLGLVVGSRLAKVVPTGKAFVYSDKVMGGAAGLVGVILLTWLVLPTAANVPGFPAQQVRTSELAQGLYNVAPDAPDTSKTLQRLVGSSTFPSVFDDLTPAPDIGPAPTAVALPQEVVDRVALSTVKVEGIACRRTQDGSGFAIAPGLVVTNAHVVAGEKNTEILTPRGNRYDATVVYYDASRDIALLQVDGYNAAPLPMAEGEIGNEGAVFGHPGGQDELAVEPAKVAQRIVAQGRDLYDLQTTQRDVLVLSASLRQGDSGGALVNTAGEVIGVAFAIAPDRADTAYALDISELQEALAVPRGDAVSTGNCIVD